jgi:LmbE family N-acetylglucosaminyl deacetylase
MGLKKVTHLNEVDFWQRQITTDSHMMNGTVKTEISGLIVVAHPDDEVLGCGGTAALLASRGISVRSCILSGNAEARMRRPELQKLHHDIRKSGEILGLGEPILGEFPNIKFNSVPHLELVRFIEQSIQSSGANILFTHHPHDLNNDHLHTSLACQAAARLFQRRPNIKPLRGLYFMEILSSTDWAFSGTQSPFLPNTFVEIGSFLDTKLKSLNAYRGVMRKYPHSRSRETVRALATLRGSQAGMNYAEAFQSAFSDLGTFLQS